MAIVSHAHREISMNKVVVNRLATNNSNIMQKGYMDVNHRQRKKSMTHIIWTLHGPRAGVWVGTLKQGALRETLRGGIIV